MRGERAALYLFDETIGMLKARAAKLGMPLEPFLESGLITAQQIDPAELSPGEFVAKVRHAVAGTDGIDAAGKPAKLLEIFGRELVQNVVKGGEVTARGMESHTGRLAKRLFHLRLGNLKLHAVVG